jgi:hypothetical protein
MARAVVASAVVLFFGCASPSTRLAGNLKHAVIHKTVRAPRSEVDQIIGTVSRESIFPIIFTTQDPRKIGGRITVYTDLSHDPPRVVAYELQRQPDGVWHIVSSGKGSIIVIPDME